MQSDSSAHCGLRGKTTEELIRLVRAWMPGLPDPHLRSREALIEAMRETDYWAMEGDECLD